jgi:hypothetical protein
MIRGFPQKDVDINELCGCLRFINDKARVLHTDLRPYNLVRFPCIPGVIPISQTSFVIDFDMAVKLPEGENGCEIDLTMSGARTDLIKEMYPDKGTMETSSVWTPEKKNVMLQWGKARHDVMRPQDRIKNRYTHKSESVSSKKSPTSNNSHPLQNNDADEIQVVVAVDPQLPSIMGKKRFFRAMIKLLALQ